MLGKWPSPAKLPETRALKVSALDQESPGSSPGGATRSAMRRYGVSRFVVPDPDAAVWLPQLSRLIETEQADLRQGDIPIFTTRPRSGDLWTSSGRRIRAFFDTPALTAVYHRLRHLGQRDLERQRWMIQAALATTAPADVVETPLPTTAARALRKPVEQARLLQAASSVGNQLASMAVRSNQEASWVGLGLEGGRHWSISPLTLDLYDGLPGVTLFLAYLGAMTDERRFTGLAHAACAGVLRRVNEYKSLAVSIGGFTGWGGILYTLAHLNALWWEPTLLIAAESIAELLPAWIEQDDQYDIIGGAAGCIGGLIALHHQRPSGRTLRVAVACGEHLLRHAERTEPGLGWTVPGQQRVPLAGFSHGAAGIAWALLKLANLSGQERFRQTALAAIAHERSLFSPEAGNWLDLRVLTTGASRQEKYGGSFMTTWCHGAPGIGLARLAALEQLDDTVVREEIDTALRTTLDHGFGRGHALCHGDLGNLELLLQAGTVLADRRWREEAYRLAGPIADCVSRNEWRCGTPREVESPGLMTGLAGIGYGLLRLAEPTRVPSVLTLEPPLGSSTTAQNGTSATR
jgi:type 2 lantibiotic biosynthesis protein LanM